jgi:hypothetical protein
MKKCVNISVKRIQEIRLHHDRLDLDRGQEAGVVDIHLQEVDLDVETIENDNDDNLDLDRAVVYVVTDRDQDLIIEEEEVAVNRIQDEDRADRAQIQEIGEEADQPLVLQVVGIVVVVVVVLIIAEDEVGDQAPLHRLHQVSKITICV